MCVCGLRQAPRSAKKKEFVRWCRTADAQDDDDAGSAHVGRLLVLGLLSLTVWAVVNEVGPI